MGNREAELKPTTFSSLLIFCVFHLLPKPPSQWTASMSAPDGQTPKGIQQGQVNPLKVVVGRLVQGDGEGGEMPLSPWAPCVGSRGGNE